MQPLLTEDDLKIWSGFTRRASLVEWLRRNGTPYLLGHGGRVCVTAEAVTLPLVKLREQAMMRSDDIDF
jgi:hypothetical protein